MTTINLRSVLGRPLTNAEVDENFFNLDEAKLELGQVFDLATAKSIPYFDASKELSVSSTFVFDGTKLGLGTATPSKKFVISNSGANGIEFQPEDASTSGLNRILSYNRVAGAYQPLVVQGSEIRLYTTGSSADQSLVIDSSGNVGIGTTPSEWGAAMDAVEFAGGNSIVGYNSHNLFLGSNTYWDGTDWRAKLTAGGSIVGLGQGEIRFYVLSEVTAGNAQTVVQAASILSDANLWVKEMNATAAIALALYNFAR